MPACCGVAGREAEPAAESPFDPAEGGRGDDPRRVGACSIGAFVEEPGLAHTHEDVEGFLGWLRRNGAVESYWLRDGEVGSDCYHRDHDIDGERRGGVDSDRIFYHSGHGFTEGRNGVFRVPMGKGSCGKSVAESSDMLIGDGRCRYVFWSTCFSLRVQKGHSPIRTWAGSTRGVRMIFGFETATVDSPHLGEHFGRQHGCGHSFAMAWLTAGWGISDGQVPAVAACGATREEAVHRLESERHFRCDPVEGAWWAWCWLGRPLYRRNPGTGPDAGACHPAAGPDPGAGQPSAGRDAGAGAAVTIRHGGAVALHLRRPAPGEGSPLDPALAERAASRALRLHGFDGDGPLVLDRIVPVNRACAAVAAPGQTAREWSGGVLVRYRQIINGLPVVSPGTGFVDLVVDGGGAVTSITSTVRTVRGRPGRLPAGAGVAGGVNGPGAPAVEPARLLEGPVADRLSALAAQGCPPVSHRIVPGSTEIGYEIGDDGPVPVAQCFLEVVGEGRGRKRHRITAPLDPGGG